VNKGSRPRAAAGIITIVGLVAIAACGGDDDSSDAPEATDAAAATTAAEAVVTTVAADTATTAAGGSATTAPASGELEVVTTPPTEMTVTEPLPSAPEPKSVAFVNCQLPACQINNQYFEAAIDALGWDSTIINYDFAAPGTAFQQAIDSGVDYIATSGVALAQIEEQVTAAKDAGIPIFECYSTDVPAGEENNLYAQCAGLLGTQAVADAMANWIIEDSGGDANILLVTIRDFPILVAQEDAVNTAFAERCSGCTVDALSATIDDLGAGEIPQQVASYIQSNADVDYVWFLFSNVSLGVSDALSSAGLLEGRNLVGTQAELPQLQEIAAGTNRAWTALPNAYSMWILVDQMARHATGVWDIEQEKVASVLPTWVVATPEAANELIPNEAWNGPEGFEDSFKELWGVAG
jgi:ribose transport system substrate-binding protein